MNRKANPRLIAPANSTTIAPKRMLADTTWDQRRKMTAAELIELMGPFHVHHPDFKERPHPLLPTKNFAGVQPVISRSAYSILRQFKALFLRRFQ